jgi:hypothetical protein
VANDYFYTLNDEGQIKKVDVKELGKSTASLNEGCIHIGPCGEKEMYWSRGKFVPFDWNKISTKSRTSHGAKITTAEIRVS